MRVKLCTLLVLVAGTGLHAETGRAAWLRYAAVSDGSARQYRETVPAVLASLSDTTAVESARRELILGIHGMLGRTLRVDSRVPAESAIVLGTLGAIRQAFPQFDAAADLEVLLDRSGRWNELVRLLERREGWTREAAPRAELLRRQAAVQGERLGRNDRAADLLRRALVDDRDREDLRAAAEGLACPMQGIGHLAKGRLKSGACGCGVAGENALVPLSVTYEHCRAKGDPHAPPDIAGEVDESRCLIPLAMRHKGIGDGVDGDKEERQTRGLDDPGHHRRSIIDFEIKSRHVEEGKRQNGHPQAHQPTRIHFSQQEPHQRHRHHGHNPPWG